MLMITQLFDDDNPPMIKKDTVTTTKTRKFDITIYDVIKTQQYDCIDCIFVTRVLVVVLLRYKKCVSRFLLRFSHHCTACIEF